MTGRSLLDEAASTAPRDPWKDGYAAARRYGRNPMTSPRHRSQPVNFRIGDWFLLVYKPAERPTQRLIENAIDGKRIGWAIRIGSWLLSVGRYVT